MVRAFDCPAFNDFYFVLFLFLYSFCVFFCCLFFVVVCFSNVLIVMVTSECYDSLSCQPANVMFDCHGNRRMLYQKRIVDTKFDIYIFVHHYCSPLM
jgi:hypothetical protein